MLVFLLDGLHDFVSFAINFFFETSVGSCNKGKNLRNETSKTGIITFFFNVSNQNERKNLPSSKEPLSNNRKLFRLLANLLILEFQSRIHYILIRITNVNNQEVNKNNENDHLIHKPSEPNNIN